MTGPGRWTSALAVALLLLSGCSAPVTDSSATSVKPGPLTTQGADTTTEEINGPTTAPQQKTIVTVQGGDLPFDVDRTWNRTQALLGIEVPPPRVLIRPEPNHSSVNIRFFGTEFGRVVGINPPTPWAVSAGFPGGSYANGEVVIYPRNASAEELESVLVHEFAHHIIGERPRGLDHSRFAVNEGMAIYVEDAYADRYLDVPDPAGRVERFYRQTKGGTRYWFGLYYFGYRYVDAQVDDQKAVRQVFQDRPQTTEQLIHGGTPETHPSEPLELQVNTTEAPWMVREPYSQMGELFVRVMLASELSEEAAARGAEGWGADALTTIEYSEANAPGYIWAIRWDTPEDADEFDMLFRKFMANRAVWTGDSWMVNSNVSISECRNEDIIVVVATPSDHTQCMEVIDLREATGVTLREKKEN